MDHVIHGFYTLQLQIRWPARKKRPKKAASWRRCAHKAWLCDIYGCLWLFEFSRYGGTIDNGWMDGWMVGWLMVDDSSIGVLTSWFIWGLFLPAYRYTYLATSIMIPGELHWTLAIGDLTGGREIWWNMEDFVDGHYGDFMEVWQFWTPQKYTELSLC